MPLYGQSLVVDYYAYDVNTGAPKTGDAANHTVYIRKDGGSLQTYSGTITEVDATNAPGLYSITLSASDMQASKVTVYVKSSTSGVLIHPIPVFTEGGRLDATVSSRMPAGNVTVGDYSVGKSPADYILQTPTNKLLTDTTGRVTVGDYAPTKSPGEQVLITPANKLATDTTGRVTAASVASDVNINMSQSLPATPTADTTGDALKRASTNLNAQVSSRAAPGDAMTLTAGERSSIAQAIMDYVVESTQTVSYTVLNVLRIIASALAGKVSGAQTNTPVFRDIADTKNRITMTVDDDGNRTTVTLDGE